jgi:hypothetical protein
MCRGHSVAHRAKLTRQKSPSTKRAKVTVFPDMANSVAIVGVLDDHANGVRPVRIRDFLRSHGYHVDLIDCSVRPSPGKSSAKSVARYTPRLIRNIAYLLSMTNESLLLRSDISKKRPHAVILENEHYAITIAFKKLTGPKVILDAPAPWYPEWKYSGDLSPLLWPLVHWIERRIYSRVDALSFHWDTYTSYVQKHIYDGDNVFSMNWGCDVPPITATYSSQPKIIYLGSLLGYWNNINLLASLATLYPIDIYGSPEPPKELGLNYKGYAATIDVIASYQLGLVTISNDPLRQAGFSSKQLAYMSYGVPTLTPDWRRDERLANYSILYNEANFLSRIHQYSELSAWTHMSTLCRRFAMQWSWSHNLTPLLTMLDVNAASA